MFKISSVPPPSPATAPNSCLPLRRPGGRREGAAGGSSNRAPLSHAYSWTDPRPPSVVLPKSQSDTSGAGFSLPPGAPLPIPGEPAAEVRERPPRLPAGSEAGPGGAGLLGGGAGLREDTAARAAGTCSRRMGPLPLSPPAMLRPPLLLLLLLLLGPGLGPSAGE